MAEDCELRMTSTLNIHDPIDAVKVERIPTDAAPTFLTVNFQFVSKVSVAIFLMDRTIATRTAQELRDLAEQVEKAIPFTWPSKLPEKITCVDDVKAFFEHLVRVDKVAFHPDDDFADYVHRGTGEPTYTEDEATLRNTLMQQAFEICEPHGQDFIYQLSILADKRVEGSVPA